MLLGQRADCQSEMEKKRDFPPNSLQGLSANIISPTSDGRQLVPAPEMSCLGRTGDLLLHTMVTGKGPRVTFMSTPMVFLRPVAQRLASLYPTAYQ